MGTGSLNWDMRDILEWSMRSKLWCQEWIKLLKKTCRSFHGCQLESAPSKPEPMTSTQLPDAPWEHLAADFMGPFLRVNTCSF